MVDIDNVIECLQEAVDQKSCFVSIRIEIISDVMELLKEYKAFKETMSEEIHKTAKMFRRTAGDNEIPLRW